VEEAHVIDPATMAELPIDDPLEAMRAAIQSEVSTREGRTFIGWTLNGEAGERVLDYELHAPNEELLFGSHVYYTVGEHGLSAELVAGVGINEFFGRFVLDYGYDGSRYTVRNIRYVPD
ncbi:hypothetical protein, partial [Paenibacillus sp. 598K]|uniref:hypothetical protein n=1 Tax=Paenibacillus sp. 598K TaxID=1117987 RepID=UPI001C88245A